MSFSIINDTAQKLFSNEVDKQLIEQVEKGHFPEDLWQQNIDLGFTTLFCKEDFGGIEAPWVDAYPVFYHLGYHQVPLPIAETAIANFILSAANSAYVTDRPIAIATIDQPQTLKMDDSNRLIGEIKNIKWARYSGYLLITINPRQFVLVDLKTEGVKIIEDVDTSQMPADTVQFTQAAIKEVIQNPFSNLEDPIKVFGAAARSVMIVGALEFALDQSVQYAKDRIQFGKPIGKNQALQQQLALMAGDVAISRASAFMACKDLPDVNQLIAPSAEFSVAAAKVCTGDAVTNGTSIAHQVHGAIGFTYEHSLNFATRRLWAWRSDFGNASQWARKIGQAFAQQPGEEFWPTLTQRILPKANKDHLQVVDHLEPTQQSGVA